MEIKFIDCLKLGIGISLGELIISRIWFYYGETKASREVSKKIRELIQVDSKSNIKDKVELGFHEYLKARV